MPKIARIDRHISSRPLACASGPFYLLLCSIPQSTHAVAGRMTSLEAPSTSSRLAGRETAAGTQRDAHDCAEDVKDYPPNARPERADTAADSTTEKKAEARAVIAPQPPEPAPALRSNDFYFLPIPKSRRYDPDKPVPFSPFLNYLFAFVGRISPSRASAPADPLRT